MPVTLSNALPNIAFSRNPILVTLQSDDYIATQPVAAVVTIAFNAALITAGTSIHLTWPNSPPVVMTAAAVPDNSGFQFPAGDGSQAAYVQDLLAYFNENYYINRDFAVSYQLVGGLNCIILTALISGDVYNIQPANDGLVNTSLLTAGVAGAVQPNFAHHLEIWVMLSGVATKVYENNLQLDYPVNGATTKDISNILNPYIGSDKPAGNEVIWKPCTNTLLPYFIKYAQFYGNTPTVKKVTTSPVVYVNYGGFSVQDALNYTLQTYLYPGSVSADTLCLRQGSKLHIVQTTQPEWLYWINLTGAPVTIRLKISAHCTDGTTTGWYYDAQQVQPWQKFYIPAGYQQLNVATNVGSNKLCDYYTACVVSTDGLYLSANYTYSVDVYREFPRFFVYLNSLGGYQTLYTWGKGQMEIDRTKDDIVRQVTYQEAAVSGKFLEANIRLQDKYTVNTGYDTLRNMKLLHDFLSSTERYYISNGNLIPVGVSSDSVKLPKDGDNLNTAQFEVYPLYDEFLFTDDADQPDDPLNSSGIVGTNGGYNAIQDDDNPGGDAYYDGN